MRRLTTTRRGGFSLIEVLIAVLILALGLLGLGAIFPVVIREQRAGTDATTALLASNAAEAFLRTQPSDPNGEVDVAFWRTLREGLGRGINQNGLGQFKVIAMPTSGPGDRADANIDGWVIPLAPRLYPGPDTGIDPQYVWDIAYGRAVDPRSVGATADDHDGVRVAVFVRRIDQRMRLATGTNLRSALLDRSIPTSDQRVPVASDRNHVPTFDGIGDTRFRYSELTEQAIQFIYDPGSNDFKYRDRLYRATPPPGSGPSPVLYWPLLAQVGQQFVDNLGNVYTVVQAGITANTPWVKVDPPVPASVTEDRAAGGPGAYGADELIRQAIFSPQIPAGVRVFTVPVEEAP
jgi:prepilin-type N-terminal cleavage/methylation domain-containing protein